MLEALLRVPGELEAPPFVRQIYGQPPVFFLWTPFCRLGKKTPEPFLFPGELF